MTCGRGRGSPALQTGMGHAMKRKKTCYRPLRKEKFRRDSRAVPVFVKRRLSYGIAPGQPCVQTTPFGCVLRGSTPPTGTLFRGHPRSSRGRENYNGRDRQLQGSCHCPRMTHLSPSAWPVAVSNVHRGETSRRQPLSLAAANLSGTFRHHGRSFVARHTHEDCEKSVQPSDTLFQDGRLRESGEPQTCSLSPVLPSSDTSPRDGLFLKRNPEQACSFWLCTE